MKRPSIIAQATLVMLVSSLSALAALSTNGQSGVVRTLSAKTLGSMKLNAVVSTSYGVGEDFVKKQLDQPLQPTVSSDGFKVVKEPAQMLSSNLALSLGVVRFLDIAVALPFYYDWPGFDELHEGGLGDVELCAKLRQPPIGRVLFQSYLLGLTAPSGTKDKGFIARHPYSIDTAGTLLKPEQAQYFYSFEKPTIKGMVLWSLDFAEGIRSFPLALHLNIGGVYNIDKNRANTALGSVAVELTPTPFITIFADAHGEVRWNSFGSSVDFFRDPFFISPGLRITTPLGVHITLAGDFSLSSQDERSRRYWNKDGTVYSTTAAPTYGAHLAIGWSGFITAQDDDHDGLKNNVDQCPKQAEDIDNHEDSDGCPDNDNDADGIADNLDKCPDKAEDVDGFEDGDGCPDPDNDMDGILDSKDSCAGQAEDFDGFEDRDGCPDFDNDRDGVADTLDRCPNDAEDFDSFEDDDGCVDLDNDKDGILDLKDKCPNMPETFNGVEDDDGCPDTKAVVKESSQMPKHQILFGVQFKSGKAEISVESFGVLEPIAAELKKFPELEIEVRGHTDSMGKYAVNMQLSQERAEAIRQYFIAQGVESVRVSAVGFGPSSPIADNRTAAGRTKNRRIEIVRLK
jgi:outer membrane protein OmpA-like peptidoglycan-associated protein